MTISEIARGAVAAAVFAAACLAADRAAGDRSASCKAYLSVRERVSRAEIVLLGNSILQKGVDEDRLSALVGRRVLKLWEGGAASAWWFVTAKNAVAAAARPPQCVLLFFRDTDLTLPMYRTDGGYRHNIEVMSTDDEPDLRRLAYRSRWESVASLLRRNCALYRRRDALRRTMEAALQTFVTARVPGAARDSFPRLAERVFDEDNMDQSLLDGALDDAEAVAEDADPFDFQDRLPASFLPLILDVLAEKHIPLVLVRTRRDSSQADEHGEAMRGYIGALERYAAARGVPLWDFSADERIGPEHFASGDHLNAEGRAVFTGMVAERLGLAESPRSDAQGLRHDPRDAFGRAAVP